MEDFLATMRQLEGRPVAADRNARELVGQVAAVLWSSPEDGAVIAKLSSGFVVKGTADEDELQSGVTYRFLGRWDTHHKHGDQFKFETYVKDTPHSRAGVIKYLMDEAPNVGRKRAEQLWEAFEGQAVEVLRTEPAQVVQAGILTEHQATEASIALAAAARLEKTKIDLFGLFAGRGFPGSLLQACIDEWGARAADRVRRDPFTLLINDMPGAGFKRCDRLYLDLGYKKDRLKRQMLCAWSALREDTNGHTWHRINTAVEAIQRNVTGAGLDPVAAIKLGVRGGWLKTRRDPPQILWITEAHKALAEQRLADRIRALQSMPNCYWPREIAPLVRPDGEVIELSPHQLENVYGLATKPVCILAGTPGTGKTFTAAALIRQVVGAHGMYAVAVCAPTGKAAVRCTAAMHGYGLGVEATTIHRLLGVSRSGRDGKGWGFLHNKDNPLPFRFVIVDESSMLDTSLASSLFEACCDGTHVLLVGDPYQLPPVGHGAPLRDLIAAGVPCGELSEIRRNAGKIVEACAAIKSGRRFETSDRYDPETGDNLRHMETAEPAEAVETLRGILRQFSASGKFDPIWDVQVLVAVNEKSELSRVALNKLLQGELNPAGRQEKGNPFKVGDKVICLKNSWMQLVEFDGPQVEDAADYTVVRGDGDGEVVEVFLANGEIGRVLAVGPKLTIARFESPDRTVKIPMGKIRPEDREEGQDGTEIKGAGNDFSLAYAITGHKSQGSEWPCVIVMADKGAGFVACREWNYTAISRASRLCVLIGPRAVVDRQCKRVSLTRRKTFLKELLQA